MILAVLFNGTLQNSISVKQAQLQEQQDIPIIQPYRQSLFKADEKMHALGKGETFTDNYRPE